MNTDIEKRYCQSCGMPLNLSRIEYLGTNTDQTPSHEFCYYCLKDGKYIVDYSMDQMIDVWIKYTDKYNGYADTSYSPDELRAVLTERMSTLNRWRQKEETENIHFEIANRIQVYINQHLFEPLNTDLLCRIASLSLFHFRRVFKSVTGENVGSYIQRLRLEYIAHKLVSTDITVSDIIRQTNVYNKYSLSKAFRKHFGVSPSDYKKNSKQQELSLTQERKNSLNLKIVRLNNLHFLYLNVGDSYKDMKKYKSLWQQLTLFVEAHNVKQAGSKFISVSHDDPLITKTEQCRFYLGITITTPVKPVGPFGVMQIPDGLYAVFSFKGHPALLPNMYRDIYLNWLPGNGYCQREPLTFEMYMNTPREVPTNDFITEIYIPIEKIKR